MGGLWESFRVALDMLRLHKLRAFLTMLGVIIGVMSVSMIILVSEAFKQYLGKQFERIGSDTIFVSYQPRELQEGQTVGGIDRLNVSDIEYIMSRSNQVGAGSAVRMAGDQTVLAGEVEAKGINTMAIDGNYLDFDNIEVVEGRRIEETDDEARANVALISEEARSKLFPDGDAVGRYVSLPGITLQVIGITKDVEAMGNRNKKMLFMPISTANEKWLGGDRADVMVFKPAAGYSVDSAMDQIWRTLMVKADNRKVYQVESSQNVQQIFQGILGTIGMLLAAIAALSLLVGGIGIMNIMLVSVTERTREIGLRKAVGARRGSILGQFVIEAGTLSLIGGLIGMGIAWGLGTLGSLITVWRKWPDETGLWAPFPITAALGAAAFSALIGVVFGLYPAVSAARLDPIVALRRE